MSIDFDAVVIGAGVVGLAVAREFALAGRHVLVLEKAAVAGTETSSRNSEVIHAGIYYPTGSLKARLCVEGRTLLYDYCSLRGVEAKRIGKIIVATSSDEEAKLKSIKALATANGVDDLQLLSPPEVSELEPEICCTKALLSPSTGIVDAAGFMLAVQSDAESHGAIFAFNTRFIRAEKVNGTFIVTTTGVNGESTDVLCRSLINCAGHGAHDVAMSIQGYAAAKLPPRYLAKGSYCSLSGKAPFRHLIYPVPVAGALGIHATLDTTGAVRFGPDIHWVDLMDYSIAAGTAETFVTAVQTYWPGVRSRTLSPSYCGIRPKIHGPDKSFADFQIQHESDHGLAGLTNLFGIESPGLTASLAIAKYVADNLPPR
jgi:L-2-hydroxyglutarate oxidase LhgO